MRHRHLTEDAGRALQAIDDVIARGGWDDWVELRQDCIEQPRLLDAVKRVCMAYAADPAAQRHRFWLQFVRRRQSQT